MKVVTPGSTNGLILHSIEGIKLCSTDGEIFGFILKYDDGYTLELDEGKTLFSSDGWFDGSREVNPQNNKLHWAYIVFFVGVIYGMLNGSELRVPLGYTDRLMLQSD